MKVNKRIPWNKNKTGLQVAWNRGRTGVYSEETKRRIGEAASIRNKGRKLTRRHKKKISEAMNKVNQKECSQCSKKYSRLNPIFKIVIPAVSEHPLMLCDTHVVEQFYALSQEDKKRVQILE
jgi:hypothetical protein